MPEVTNRSAVGRVPGMNLNLQSVLVLVILVILIVFLVERLL